MQRAAGLLQTQQSKAVPESFRRKLEARRAAAAEAAAAAQKRDRLARAQARAAAMAARGAKEGGEAEAPRKRGTEGIRDEGADA
eukprot:3221487-Prymnesium_polylepis.1